MFDDIFDMSIGNEEVEDGPLVSSRTTTEDKEWLFDTAMQAAEIVQSAHHLHSGGVTPLELMRFMAMIDNEYLSDKPAASIEEYYVDRVLDSIIN